MLLVGEHEEDGWIYSTFNLTYRVAWEQLLLAVYGAYRFFSDPEVLVDGKPVEIGDPAEILTIAEDRNIMLRGISTVIAAPLMITFFNQVHFVNVSVGAVNDEFRDTDYEKYNKSMCQLMDSMEIMMHLPAPTAKEEPAVSDTSAAQEAAPDTDEVSAQAPTGDEPSADDAQPADEEAAPDTDEVSAQAPAGDEPSADEAQPAAEELFASDEDAQERPVAEAPAPAEAQAPAEEDPAVSDTPAAQKAAPDTDEVSAQAPAGDEAQPADEQVSPLSRLSMELGIPQPPA